MTAIAFATAIDDPTRSRRFRQVGCLPWPDAAPLPVGRGRSQDQISKAGDGLTRTLLFEAANALLTRSRKRSALKAWAEAIAARCSRGKAKVALAIPLAVLLHRLWCDQVTFRADTMQPAAA